MSPVDAARPMHQIAGLPACAVACERAFMFTTGGPNRDDADALLAVLERIARDLEHVLCGVVAIAVLLAAILGVLV